MYMELMCQTATLCWVGFDTIRFSRWLNSVVWRTDSGRWARPVRKSLDNDFCETLTCFYCSNSFYLQRNYIMNRYLLLLPTENDVKE